MLNNFVSVLALAGAAAVMAESSGNVHVVTAGKGNFMFQPNNITAQVGDIVSVQFYPTNHSVVQGVYCGDTNCNPCVPIELVQPGATGFHSQNILTTHDANPKNLTYQTFNITIQDETPIWFYCTAVDSCVQQGMVGVINGAVNQDVSKQVKVAIAAPFQLSPGQSLPPSASPGTHLSGGAIAGIVVGGLFVLALAVGLFYFVSRNKAQKRVRESPASEKAHLDPHAVNQHASWSPFPSPNPTGQFDPPQYHHPHPYFTPSHSPEQIRLSVQPPPAVEMPADGPVIAEVGPYR